MKQIAKIGKAVFLEKDGPLIPFNKVIIIVEGLNPAVIPYTHKAKEGQYLITYDPKTGDGLALTITDTLAFLNDNQKALIIAAQINGKTAVNIELLKLLSGPYSIEELQNTVNTQGRPFEELL
jgi:hypothetical protein